MIMAENLMKLLHIGTVCEHGIISQTSIIQETCHDFRKQ